MESSGLSYFVNSANLTGDFKIFYDFNTISNIIPSVPYADSQFSGVLSGATGSFDGVSGFGLLSGNNYITIQNPDLIDQKFWTMFFSYETFESKQGVLFSNYSEFSGNKSGFAIGLNASNKMFFESYVNNEPFILESPFNYFNKNLTTITRYNSNISFGLYDFDERTFNESSHSLSSSALKFSNNWYLGRDINSPSYFSGGALNGYMEAFLYFSKPLSINEKNIVASGFYYTATTGGLNITYDTFTGITGYSTGQVIVGSGITGYDTVSLGFLTGDWCDCNDNDEIFETVALTGYFYDYTSIPLTGVITGYTTGINSDSLILIEKDLSTYGPRAFSYLKKVNNLDLTEFLRVSGGYPNELNNIAQFDSISGKYFIDFEDYQYDDVNLYSNTLAQFTNATTGQGFYTISNTGSLLNRYFNGQYINTDELIYDNITGSGLFYGGALHPINGFSGISGFAPPHSMYFYNGVKLKSGIEYIISGNDFILTSNTLINNFGNTSNSGVTWDSSFILFDNNILTFDTTISNFENTIFTLPLPELYYINTGIFNNLIVGDYKTNGSMIFLNGLRQKNKIDYLELSTRSLLLGSGLFI